jgi:hypothetical protein
MRYYIITEAELDRIEFNATDVACKSKFAKTQSIGKLHCIEMVRKNAKELDFDTVVFQVSQLGLGEKGSTDVVKLIRKLLHK